MVPSDALGLLLGAVALGAIHGVEPGHGWPVAATYALDRTHHVLYGLLASVVIGVGHLVSSLAMVAAFFYAKSYFELEAVNEPITLFETVQIGGPVSVVAGVLLIALGVREARHGHSHSHGSGHSHSHGSDHSNGHDHGHTHADGHTHDGGAHASHGHGRGHNHDQDYGHDHSLDHDHGGAIHEPDESVCSRAGGGFRARISSLGASVRGLLPGSDSHGHDHAGHDHALEGGADRGLYGIAWFAFVLGFAHEEEFEIIALCAGSVYCLELMVAYALTVLVSIVGLTMLLIAGYQRAEARVERYAPYLPLFSAVVLGGMGLGFVAGVL